MVRIKIRDLPKDQKVSRAEMKKVVGGFVKIAGINLQAGNLPGIQVLGIEGACPRGSNNKTGYCIRKNVKMSCVTQLIS